MRHVFEQQEEARATGRYTLFKFLIHSECSRSLFKTFIFHSIRFVGFDPRRAREAAFRKFTSEQAAAQFVEHIQRIEETVQREGWSLRPMRWVVGMLVAATAPTLAYLLVHRSNWKGCTRVIVNARLANKLITRTRSILRDTPSRGLGGGIKSS